MDKLQSMRVFAKVVEQKSFVKAALALDLSNAVVSRHVAHLEQELGVRLLHRTTRRLSLTSAGQAYVDQISPMLMQLSEIEKMASGMALQPAGTLRIYAQLGFGERYLGNLLSDFSRIYPEVRFDVTLSERTLDLVEASCDVGIFLDLQKFSTDMISRQFATSELVVCAAPSYIAANGAPSSLDDIGRHTCLNFSSYDLPKGHWLIHGEHTKHHVAVQSNLVSNNGALLRSAAVAGMGLLFTASFAVSNDISAGRLVRVLGDYPLGKTSLYLVYPSRRFVPASVRRFLDFLAARFPCPECDPWLVQDASHRHEPSEIRNPISSGSESGKARPQGDAPTRTGASLAVG